MPGMIIAWAGAGRSFSRESADSFRMESQTRGFLPKELIPKTKHVSPVQPSVPESCYIRDWTGTTSNVCPHQDTCNKWEIIPGRSMMLSSSLSLGTSCSPESLEQEAKLALLHWRHFQGSSGPALASSHGQNNLELHPYLCLLRFFSLNQNRNMTQQLFALQKWHFGATPSH